MVLGEVTLCLVHLEPLLEVNPGVSFHYQLVIQFQTECGSIGFKPLYSRNQANLSQSI